MILNKKHFYFVKHVAKTHLYLFLKFSKLETSTNIGYISTEAVSSTDEHFMSSTPIRVYESTSQNGNTIINNPEYASQRAMTTDSESYLWTTTEPTIRKPTDNITARLETNANMGFTDKTYSEGHSFVTNAISTSAYKKLWEIVNKNSTQITIDKIPSEATYGSTLGVLGIVLVCALLALLILSDLNLLREHFKHMMVNLRMHNK